MQFRKEFITQSIYYLTESSRMINKSFEELSEEDIWKRPNASSNSIGTIIVHLCGNITQYIVSALGGDEDRRERDSEFATHSGYNKKQLLEKLMSTVEKAKSVIEAADEEKLLRNYSVQGFDLSGIGIVIHVVEHYSYHTGQIAYWTKMLKDTDLGFYSEVDLNAKNKM